MAIFEFSSSNGFSSFNINFECRYTVIAEIGDEIYYHFSYLVNLPYYWSQWTSSTCEERGYEEWKTDLGDYYCITTFQGKKCSMI